MPFLPVAAREARGAARSVRLYAWRAGIVAIGVAMVPTVLWMGRGATSQGASLFASLSGMAFFYCLLGGALRTADALAQERRENTLGLLFLTDLKARDVLSGKLLASTATVFFGLLAILPILAIPLLLGGVTSKQLFETAINLLNTLFLSISIGFLVSTVVHEGWATVSVALILVLFLGVGIPSIASLRELDRDDPLWITLLFFSPSYAQAQAFEGGAGGQIEFWATVGVNHLMAWLCLLYTAKYLPRAGQEVPRSARGEIWWQRMQELRFGGAKTRTKFRRRLLDSNPLYWLSGREQVSSSGLMIVLMFIVALSLAGEWQGILIGLVVLHLVLLTRMASATSHALAEDRKSGALELLLGTSLSIGDLLKGRWLALRRQFFGPALIVSVWHFFAVAWMSMVEFSNELYLLLAFSWVVFFLAWLATGWCGMWFGLRARHPLAAMTYTISTVLLAPWLLLVTAYGVASASGLLQTQTTYFSPFTPGSYYIDERLSHVAEAFFVWAIYLFALCAWASQRIKARFREAASDRFISAAVDWARMRKAAVIFGSLVAAGLLLMVGYRRWINFTGERAFREALAAHPNFSLEKPYAPACPQAENLANWDFLGMINNSGTYVPYYVGRAGPRSLREIIGFGGYQPDAALEAWRQGKTLHIKGKASASIQETATAYLKRFAAYDPDVERLLKAAKERPYIQFSEKAAAAPTQFWQPPNYWAETAVQMLAQFLARRACAKIQLRQNALEETLLCARFANSTTNAHRPELWQQALAVAIQPVYDGIVAGAWSDSDLRAIQKQFEGIDALADYPRWIEAEVRARVAVMEKPIPQAVQMAANGFQVTMMQRQEELPGRIKQREAAIIRLGLEKLVKSVDLTKRIVPPLEPLSIALRTGQILPEFVYQAQVALENLARIQTAAHEVKLACALERFRLERGTYPATLNELVPKFVASERLLPTDVIDGAPLRYRAENNGLGYVLYSIGWDRSDDHGKPEVSGAGDWAWIIRR